MNADRDILFGLLARQLEFIARDQLAKVLEECDLETSQSLGEILVEEEILTPADRGMLEQIVDRHVELHDGDTGISIASLNAATGVHHDLTPGLPATLEFLADHSDSNTYGVGQSTSSGTRFHVLRPHAEGGLGKVSIAVDSELKREVALKEIKTEHAYERDSQARFTQEAEITGGLEHPGIVPVYGLGTFQDGRPFYAMRFIKGDSLKDVIREHHNQKSTMDPSERSLQLRKLLGRYIDVCNSMEYAHSRGVLHRDIKPSNIMLGKYGETLVVDWGLSKVIGRDGVEPSDEPPFDPGHDSGSAPTQIGAAIGTPQYMPPEQAAGRLDQLGPRSDVYSLGATLYFLLVGKSPFEIRDLGQLLTKVKEGQFPRPREVESSIPKPLEAICLKAMSLDSDQRYASPRWIADDLEHWLADESVIAIRDPLTTRIFRWCRRNRTVVGSAVAVLAVSVVALAVGNVLLTDANRRIVEQQRLAEANFQQARAAVDEFFTEVSENTLLGVPGLQPLRRQLLESALNYHVAFIAQRSDDPTLREELAEAHLRVGHIKTVLGPQEQALDSFRIAMQMYEEMARADKTNLAFLEDVGKTHLRIASLQLAIGKQPQALQSYQTAMAISGRLLEQDRSNDEYRNDLAVAHCGIAQCQELNGQTEDSLKSYQCGIEVRKEIKPEMYDKFFWDSQVNSSRMAALLAETGRSEEALAEFQKGRTLLEQALRHKPGKVSAQAALARTQFNIGVIQSDLGRLSEALDAYSQSVTTQEQLVKQNPTVIDYISNLGTTLDGMARIQETLGKFEESMSSYRRSIELFQQLVVLDPTVPKYQDHLAARYVNCSTLQAKLFDLEGAIESLTEAGRIQQNIADKYSKVPRYKNVLASVYNNLSNRHLAVGQLEAATTTIEQAVAIREQITKDHPAVEDYWLDLAVSIVNLGNIEAKKGDLDQAAQTHQKAYVILKRICEQSPTRVRNQDQLAHCLSAQGKVEYSRNDLEKAAVLTQQALETWQQSLGHAERRPNYEGIANTYDTMGVIRKTQGRSTEALDCWSKSAEMLKQLLDDQPGCAEYRADLGLTYSNMGGTLKGLGNLADSEKLLTQSVSEFDSLRRQFPTVSRFKDMYATASGNLGNTKRALGDTAAALTLYNTAIEVGEKLVRDNPDVPRYSQTLSNSYDNLAQLQISIGRKTEAMATLQKQIALSQKDVAKSPANLEASYSVSSTHFQIGNVHLSNGRLPEAVEAYQQAIDHLEPLTAENPSITKFQSQLASCYANRGIAQKKDEQWDDARKSYHRAIEICEHLVNEEPESYEHRNSLVIYYGNRGNLAKAQSENDEALSWYTKETELRENLTRSDPKAERYRVDLGRRYYETAAFLLQAGSIEQAVEWNQKAIDALQVIRESKGARALLIVSHRSRAMGLLKLKRYNEAVQDFDYAIPLSESAIRDSLQLGRAQGLIMVGRHREATIQVEQIVNAESVRGTVLFGSAQILSLATEAASKDMRLPEMERKLLSGQYASRAMKLLERARKQKFFSSKEKRTQLESSSNFDALEHRDDFLELLDAIKSEGTSPM